MPNTRMATQILIGSAILNPNQKEGQHTKNAHSPRNTKTKNSLKQNILLEMPNGICPSFLCFKVRELISTLL